jgi:hypothetical protein
MNGISYADVFNGHAFLPMGAAKDDHVKRLIKRRGSGRSLSLTPRPHPRRLFINRRRA